MYVDDLYIASKCPEKITKMLVEKYRFKLKGVGELAFHLGCDFKRDKDGTLYYGPKWYIKKMVTSFKQMFNNEETLCSLPLVERDHQKLDMSEYLTPDDVIKYQSLISFFQWAISLRRFNIQTRVMILSCFRVNPRKNTWNVQNES